MLSEAEYIPSPNFDNRPDGFIVNSIVIHCISLPSANFKDIYIKQLFTNKLDISEHPYFKLLENTKVSSHLLIDRDGKITQFVPFDKRAWHAGKSEYNNHKNFNDFSIGVELIGSDNTYFDEKQYVALSKVIKKLKNIYPIDNQNIYAHSDIAPNRKTDPGMCFNWEYFFKLVNDEVIV